VVFATVVLQSVKKLEWLYERREPYYYAANGRRDNAVVTPGNVHDSYASLILLLFGRIYVEKPGYA